MNGLSNFYTLGTIALINEQGSKSNLLAKIKELQKAGKFTRKEAFDIRQAIAHAARERDRYVTKSVTGKIVKLKIQTSK